MYVWLCISYQLPPYTLTSAVTSGAEEKRRVQFISHQVAFLKGAVKAYTFTVLFNQS
jgi:hypothetical protein